MADEFLRRNARFRESNKFGDSVIFAIAAVGLKRFERGAPMVGNTPLFEIAHLLDCKINRTVDHPDTGAAGLSVTRRNDGEEFLCLPRTIIHIFAATRQNSALGADIGLDAFPFHKNVPSEPGDGFETERFPLARRFDAHHCRIERRHLSLHRSEERSHPARNTRCSHKTVPLAERISYQPNGSGLATSRIGGLSCYLV